MDEASSSAGPSGRDLVLAVARELSALRVLVGDLPVAGAGLPEEALRAAQGQDLAEQTLGALASFLTQSAPGFSQEPLQGLQPAFDAIGLAALAGRLSGTSRAPSTSGGELELF